MLVACKFEEVYPPKTKDFVYITDSAYSKQQVLQTEVDILRVLEYNIASPTPYQFLEILSSSLRLTPQEFHFAQFLLELSVLEYSLLQHTPSVQAGSAAFVACKLLRTGSPQMPYFERGELRKCAKDLVVLV
jgi:cyclin B